MVQTSICFDRLLDITRCHFRSALTFLVPYCSFRLERWVFNCLAHVSLAWHKPRVSPEVHTCCGVSNLSAYTCCTTLCSNDFVSCEGDDLFKRYSSTYVV